MTSSSQPSRILVLGATGKTGRLLVAEALKRHIAVTALVRSSNALAQASGLTVVEGTPLEYPDVEKAVMATTDRPGAILSTLGQTRRSGNPWSAPTSPPRFMADAMKNAVAAAQKFRIPKIIVMSMFGAGSSMKNLNFLMRGIMRWSNMAQTLEDHNLVDEIVKASGIDFVLVRPAMLKDGKGGPIQHIGDAGEEAAFMPAISSEVVAGFLLGAVTGSEWDRRTPVICS